MSETATSLRRKLATAGDLQSVVRTMKAVAAASIGQYDRSVRALADYCRAVEVGLGACLRSDGPTAFAGASKGRRHSGAIGAVVFGSDQGLVGQFNEVVVEEAVKTLAALPGPHRVWTVGERVHARLTEVHLRPVGLFDVPHSTKAITPLVGQILVEIQSLSRSDDVTEIYLVHNRSTSHAAYEPTHQRLLPLDETWRSKQAAVPWPTQTLPEVVGGSTATLGALVREYLFISIFRACAESLASENASRLAAMERADQNIDELLEGLRSASQRLRQTSIDEELFDVISGFAAQSESRR